MIADVTVVDRNGPLRDCEALADTVKTHPLVEGAPPYLRAAAKSLDKASAQGVVAACARASRTLTPT